MTNKTITWTYEDLDLIYESHESIFQQDADQCMTGIILISRHIERMVQPAGWSSVDFSPEDVREALRLTGEIDPETMAYHQSLASRIGERMAVKLAA